MPSQHLRSHEGGQDEHQYISIKIVNKSQTSPVPSTLMAAHIPTEFPPLPNNGPLLGGWPANIQEAHSILENTFHHGLNLVQQEGGDPIRLNHTSEQLVNDSVRILERMEESGVSPEFTRQCANAIGPLVFELEVATMSAVGMYV